MDFKRNITKKTNVGGDLYQDSVRIDFKLESPEVTLRLAKDDFLLFKTMMDSIACAAQEIDGHPVEWTLKNGKAELKTEPVSLFEREKKIVVPTTETDQYALEEWISHSCEESDSIIAHIRTDGEYDFQDVKVKGKGFIVRCELGVQMERGTIHEDIVFYDNLFFTDWGYDIPDGIMLFTFNADRGLKVQIVKAGNKYRVNTKFYLSSWENLRWYMMFQRKQKHCKHLYLRAVESMGSMKAGTYIFRLKNEEGRFTQIDNYDEVIDFIDSIELIQKQLDVKIKPTEKYEQKQLEFILLLARSLRGEFTDFDWEDSILTVRPSPENAKYMLECGKDGEFLFQYKEYIDCEFDGITFEKYLCINVVERAVIENYEEVRCTIEQKDKPIIIRLKPGTSNKWHRILQLPEELMIGNEGKSEENG